MFEDHLWSGVLIFNATLLSCGESGGQSTGCDAMKSALHGCTLFTLLCYERICCHVLYIEILCIPVRVRYIQGRLYCLFSEILCKFQKKKIIRLALAPSIKDGIILSACIGANYFCF